MQLPISEIIEAVKKHPYAVHADTALLQFWAGERIDKNETLPNPPCHCIIPIQAGYWNRVKGGSDVLIQLCNNTKSDPPIKSPQSAVANQNIPIVKACIHQSNQICLANENLVVCSSLEALPKCYKFQVQLLRDIAWPWLMYLPAMLNMANLEFQKQEKCRAAIYDKQKEGSLGKSWLGSKTGRGYSKKKSWSLIWKKAQVLITFLWTPTATPWLPNQVNSRGPREAPKKMFIMQQNYRFVLHRTSPFCLYGWAPRKFGDGILRSEVGTTADGRVDEILGRITCFLHLHQTALEWTALSPPLSMIKKCDRNVVLLLLFNF